jgi:Zn-dependent peptidase ImmA (M78 family)
MRTKVNGKTFLKVARKTAQVYNAILLGYTACEFIKARGVGKEDDLNMINEVYNKVMGLPCTPDKIININGTDLSVSYNPYMHLCCKNLGSIASRMVNTNEVYVDNTFRKMSKTTQLFILCHELGHIKCKHDNISSSYNRDRLKAVMKDQVLDIELEADAYAGECLETLFPNKPRKELIKLATKALEEQASFTKGFTKRELKLRAYLIKNYSFSRKPEELKKHVYLKYSETLKREFS